MTGETLSDLLKPLIGRPGSIHLIIKRIGPVGFSATETNKLTGVVVSSDGLVRVERETGWTVVDPREIVAVSWSGQPEGSTGQFL